MLQDFHVLLARAHPSLSLRLQTGLCYQMLFQTTAQMSSCTSHYHDISLFFIHDLTYKARTVAVHTRRPGDHRYCLFSTTKQAAECLWAIISLA